ncbi:hypothetical protein IH824_07895 [candidate division KSB1 bacterium]|nr:hypothetical protein [candidate division KSB1 bacterium]
MLHEKPELEADPISIKEDAKELEQVVKNAMNDAYRDNGKDSTVNDQSKVWSDFMDTLWNKGVRLIDGP